MSIAKMLQGLAGNEDFEELVIRQKLLAAKEELFLKNQVIVPEKSGEQIDIHEPVFFFFSPNGYPTVLYVQEVVNQPRILNRTILLNLVHVT